MTATDFHDRIFALLRREPFEPFEIELDDGRRIMIRDPQVVATNGSIAAVWGPNPEDELISFDWMTTRRLGNAAPTP